MNCLARTFLNGWVSATKRSFPCQRRGAPCPLWTASARPGVIAGRPFYGCVVCLQLVEKPLTPPSGMVRMWVTLEWARDLDWPPHGDEQRSGARQSAMGADRRCTRARPAPNGESWRALTPHNAPPARFCGFRKLPSSAGQRTSVHAWSGPSRRRLFFHQFLRRQIVVSGHVVHVGVMAEDEGPPSRR